MPISEFTTMKLHVNSTISDVKSIYMCMGVKYSYFNNKMGRVENIMIQIFMIPQAFFYKYKLKGESKQWVHIRTGN